jgi:translation initiation factor IF-2
VTSTRGKKEATVFGSKVMTGHFDTKSKYQVIRDDEVIHDNLSLSSLRHLKNTVQRIDKGNECGVVFEKDFDFWRGDIIESYIEKEVDHEKFDHKAGVSKTF